MPRTAMQYMSSGKWSEMNDRTDIVPALEAYQAESGQRLWWFGGPSYALGSPDTIVYVDPYYSDQRADDPRGFNRAIPNYFFPETVTRADLVLSTHNHSDHCDPATLWPIYERTQARFAAAPSSARLMAEWGFAPERVQVMPPGAMLQLGDTRLTSYPARDWEDEGAVTFVLEAGGAAVFIGGDTLYLDELEAIGHAHRIDLAVLALARNRRDIIDEQLYLNPDDLARAATALGARRVLPIHWDIWKAWAEDPLTVAPHLAGSGIELIILAQGHTLDLLGGR